ncbi:NAM7-nonsense-mediated mRNA decay [Fusarium subglutinans]|uniref:NAM7-nonsense-mediated mRNA decay n=1 Tax=Gibberella subglutinans TaxID=42677 RepID=A0A8H5P647_GIBSU|nr:NAM7-nonsense-mediated mRNA decay [Fusarium subglutinans]KAF5590648.1 NAM7-nonsense-mediated mRNA decay [Fusarium subglutinans]
MPRDQTPLEIITQHVKHKNNLPKTGSVPWHMAPEFPHSSELMSIDPAPLPPPPIVKELSERDAKNAYLEFQYITNRFEGTELLRQAVNCFKNKPRMMEGDRDNFYIYTQVRHIFYFLKSTTNNYKVHVQGYLFARSGPACRIAFSTERSPTKVEWKQSNRLTAGTLIALSPKDDNFNTQCYVAVVAARYIVGGLEPDPADNEGKDTPPRIEIFWSDCNNAVFDPSIEMVMLEAKGGYFETVRHAMVGLQHAAMFDSKFDKYIIHESNTEHTTAYLADTPRQTPRIPDRADHLDPSQREALERMTHKELAVIQGPPGTGKTFTSVVAIESYVQTLKARREEKKEDIPPVVVAAQTNHALDQLLDRLSVFEAVIVRLGGRTEDEAIEERTLFNLKSKKGKGAGGIGGEPARRKVLGTIETLLSECFPAFLIPAEEFHREGLLSDAQYKSLDDDEWESATLVNRDDGTEIECRIAHWLQVIEDDTTVDIRPPQNQAENPAKDDAPEETQQENQKERLKGAFFPMKFNVTGALPTALSKQASWVHRARRLLKMNQDLYKIKPNERGMVYRLLREELIRARAQKFPQLLKEYQEACDDIKVSRWESDVRLITSERIEIVGCTTTGLSKYRGMIAALKPRILMIEEAAETREANISSVLYPSLDQVVLVGDHQQLVPSVDVRDLGRDPYNMHVSLFERLVKLKLPYSMLRVQRRMVPAIREVVNAFYPQLTDHCSVYDPDNRPPIPGMGGKSLWWFDHEGQEMQNVNDFSFSNPDEADMIVGFVRYLVQNGVDPERITILTFYKGQVALITEKLRRDLYLEIKNPLKKWSVRTVDGFQGEENDVILLSLVRTVGPGFIGNANRANVGTSRARCGMYVFGNSQTLVRDENSEAYSTWRKVIDVFERRQCIDNYLPVTCHNHGTRTNLKNASGWKYIPGGGCDKGCESTCAKGHPCKLTCHKFDHSEVKCLEKCEEVLKCGHSCESLCWQPCQCPSRCDEAPKMKLPLRPSPLPARAPKRPNNRHQSRSNRTSSGGPRHETSPTGRSDPFEAQSPRAQTPTHMAQARKHCLEPTSEEIMEGGYYAETIQQVRQTAGNTITTTAVLESFADTSKESSRRQNWSPEKLAKKDKELADDAKAKRRQKSPESIHISGIWHRTTTSDALHRRREEKVETHWSMEVSTCKEAEPSRGEPAKSGTEIGLESSMDDGAQEDKAEDDEDEEEDDDLISFD